LTSKLKGYNYSYIKWQRFGVSNLLIVLQPLSTALLHDDTMVWVTHLHAVPVTLVSK